MAQNVGQPAGKAYGEVPAEEQLKAISHPPIILPVSPLIECYAPALC